MYDEEIPEYGDVFTVQEFREMVNYGVLIDYDGVGHAAKNGMMARGQVLPSKVNDIPADATHIVWFNK